MSEQSIRALIAALDASNRLARVARPVDPARELAAVALKAHRDRGQAVLFANAASWRAAAQLLADRAQWAVGLRVPATELLGAVERRLRTPIAPAMVGAGAPVAARRHEAPELGLETLPIPRAADTDDAAQMVAVVIAVDPDTGQDCIGLTRHHVVAPGQLSVIGLCPALERLHQRYRRHGTKMPLALAVGGDPALYLAAALGTWRAADMALAGGLADAPIKLWREGALAVPAEAEWVAVGTLSPSETASPGRLVTSFGLSADAGAVPVFAAQTVLQRADPVFYAMHVGAPGDHTAALCLAAEALVAQHIRNIEGGIDVLDISCAAAAGGLVVVIKLRGRVEGQTKTALMGALSGPANGFKLAIAVDDDVDAADLRDVFWSVASRTHAEIDVGMIDGLRAHPDDAAAPEDANGARTATRWFVDSTMGPMTQPKRRADFARAIPKNLSATDLAAFLPKT